MSVRFPFSAKIRRARRAVMAAAAVAVTVPVALATCSAAFASPAAPAAPAATASGLPWASGVYLSGATPASVAGFGAWRGRPVDVVTAWGNRATWNDITDPAFLYKQWKGTSKTLALGVAMLPEHVAGGSLQACAAGDYNAHWRQFGTDIAAYGLGRSVIRLGWEFNGNWYAWQATNPVTWAACWGQIVTSARATPPAPGLPRQRLRHHRRGRQLRHVARRDQRRELAKAAQRPAGTELLARLRQSPRQEVRRPGMGQRHHRRLPRRRQHRLRQRHARLLQNQRSQHRLRIGLPGQHRRRQLRHQRPLRRHQHPRPPRRRHLQNRLLTHHPAPAGQRAPTRARCPVRHAAEPGPLCGSAAYADQPSRRPSRQLRRRKAAPSRDGLLRLRGSFRPVRVKSG